MRYVFMQYFGPIGMSYISADEKLDIAKHNAVEALAKELLKTAVFEVTSNNCLRCIVDI